MRILLGTAIMVALHHFGEFDEDGAAFFVCFVGWVLCWIQDISEIVRGRE